MGRSVVKTPLYQAFALLVTMCVASVTLVLENERIIAAAHIGKGRELLRESGISLHACNQIIKSFNLETFRVG